MNYLLLPGLCVALGLSLMVWQAISKKSKKPGQGRELDPNVPLDPEELGTFPVALTPAAPIEHSIFQRLGKLLGMPEPEGRRVVIGENARYQHMQIVGASGTGKTRHAIYPMVCQDIMRGAGVAVFDVKSNMRHKIASFAHQYSRLQDMLVFDVTTPENGLQYSPLIGNDPSEVANRIWTAFYQGDDTPTPFYRESALSYIRNFMSLCGKLGVLPTLIQLQQCVAAQAVLEALVVQLPGSPEAEFFKKRYIRMKQSDYVQLFEGFMNKLTPLVSGPFASLLNTTTPNILMRDVVTRGRILVFGLAADLYPSDYKIVSTMALMDLQSCLTARYGTGSKGFFVYLDEFADLVYPEMGTLIAKAREANVGLVIAHQALGDLRAISESLQDRIMSNMSNKMIFRLGTADTAEQISRLMGTKTEIQDLINYSLQGGGVFSNKTAKGVTHVPGEAFLVHPNELKNLAVGEAVMITQRKAGRELHRGFTLTAPDIPPVDPSLLPRPKPATLFKPLILKAPSKGIPGSVPAQGGTLSGSVRDMIGRSGADQPKPGSNDSK